MIHHPPEYVLHNSQTSHILIQDNNIQNSLQYLFSEYVRIAFYYSVQLFFPLSELHVASFTWSLLLFISHSYVTAK